MRRSLRKWQPEGWSTLQILRVQQTMQPWLLSVVLNQSGWLNLEESLTGLNWLDYK